jgi:hypothetical protein
MGYYNYQDGLIYRHLNQEGGWDEHNARCRSFILKALGIYKPERVTVLGSGWLLDLPVAEMVDMTGKIFLVDIVHPPDVIIQAGKFKNIELIEQDISGGLIGEVWQKSKGFSFFKKMKSLENISIPEYKPVNEPGMVISLNILTQLESLLIDFIRKRSKIREEDFDRFRAEIQTKHLDFLRKFSSVLITDIAEVFTDDSGNKTTSHTLFAELPSGQYTEEWDWHFDLVRSDYYKKRSVFKVAAIIL